MITPRDKNRSYISGIDSSFFFFFFYIAAFPVTTGSALVSTRREFVSSVYATYLDASFKFPAWRANLQSRFVLLLHSLKLHYLLSRTIFSHRCVFFSIPKIFIIFFVSTFARASALYLYRRKS